MSRPFRLAVLGTVAGISLLTTTSPVMACAGLVTPSGNVRLLRTVTLAAWADGVEHYVTSFKFDGGGGSGGTPDGERAEVGSIVPLPGIPTKVERGGDWTLQRLEREPFRPFRGGTAAAAAAPAPAASGSARVIYETKIDALDITILEGGGPAVSDWAHENGFALTVDAPQVLDYYARRSPIFMAARYDANAARERGQQAGEGTPVHLTIPVAQPWVPLRILGLGRNPADRINAIVYLLTPEQPDLLPKPVGAFAGDPAPPPGPGSGLIPGRDEPASEFLLRDLRTDKGMEWIPPKMWFTSIQVNENSPNLSYDLSVGVPGQGPSRAAAGLPAEPAPPPSTTTTGRPRPTTTTAVPSTTTSPPPTTTLPAAEPDAALPPVPAWVPEPEPGPLFTAAPLRDSGGRRKIGPLVAVATVAGGGAGAALVGAVLNRRRSGGRP